jgi:transposase
MLFCNRKWRYAPRSNSDPKGERPMKQSTPYAAGLDISDREMKVCVLGPSGKVHEESTVPVDRDVLKLYFKRLLKLEPVVALETGTHANWVYDLLVELGFSKVIVADARQLKMIYESNKKTDELDARLLARYAQACPDLLHPVQPRGEQARQDRRLLSARNVCVETRTKLVAYVRGIVKSTGARLPSCDPDNFAALVKMLPDSLKPILTPVMSIIGPLSEKIHAFDELIEKRCKANPATKCLKQVNGVGPITALAFAATVEDPMRFTRNRNIASFIGVRPRIDESGTLKKQLGITKAGDGYLRQLLVISAHTILRQRSPVTDLKRWGQSIAKAGGKRGKRRAAVAVARKLAVLLLALWKSGAKYQPLRKRTPTPQEAGAVTPVARVTRRVKSSNARTAK